MSTENLKEYARRCATEPELLARAKEFGLTDMDKHMRYAESLGLDWTTGDLAAFRKEVIDAEGDFDDLSEEELEQVAGGAFSTTMAVSVAVGLAVGAGATVAVTSASVGGGTAAGDGGW